MFLIRAKDKAYVLLDPQGKDTVTLATWSSSLPPSLDIFSSSFISISFQRALWLFTLLTE